MTTIEHAFLGVNIVMATGLERRYGWQLAAFAGICAIVPDWDALTIIYSLELFGESHRVWGHNLLFCVLFGLFIGCVDYFYDLVMRVVFFLSRLFKVSSLGINFSVRDKFSFMGLFVWVFFAIISLLSHLVADVVSSGGVGLPDWELKLLIPFSDRGFVYPLHQWGDVGVTLIFVAGMFAMLKWKSKTNIVAILTLIAVIAYIIL
ncbi:MAG: metal-dependent hydrolase [Planctomycetaceae bacterium]|jgi:hypothetical protein|nr:metal-dependent hydrolase [Planctomycetaceae bacterium]